MKSDSNQNKQPEEKQVMGQESAQSNQPEKEDPSKSASEENVTLSRQDFDKLQSKITTLEALKENMLRSAADFENAKKRLMRERDDYVKFAQESLIRSILPALDNFERALDHIGDIQDPKAKNVVTGVQMVLKQLSEALKAQGLVRLQSVGTIFDPHVHEAIGYIQEEGKEDEVVEEIEAGYKLHERVLRAAKVKVRMRPAGTSAQNTEGEKEEEIT